MRRRSLMIALASPLMAVGLSACGFTPLYADGGAVAGLSRIDVTAPDGRTAYLLRERLDDVLGRDIGAPATYGLAFTLAERRDPRGLGPDNAASRYELFVQVDYVLSELATGAALTTGRQEVLVSYEAVSEPYAGIVAQQDGQERAAAEAARRIRLDLARYFMNSTG
jgi:LPS-assembly lipoprotein